MKLVKFSLTKNPLLTAQGGNIYHYRLPDNEAFDRAEYSSIALTIVSYPPAADGQASLSGRDLYVYRTSYSEYSFSYTFFMYFCDTREVRVQENPDTLTGDFVRWARGIASIGGMSFSIENLSIGFLEKSGTSVEIKNDVISKEYFSGNVSGYASVVSIYSGDGSTFSLLFSGKMRSITRGTSTTSIYVDNFARELEIVPTFGDRIDTDGDVYFEDYQGNDVPIKCLLSDEIPSYKELDNIVIPVGGIGSNSTIDTEKFFKAQRTGDTTFALFKVPKYYSATTPFALTTPTMSLTASSTTRYTYDGGGANETITLFNASGLTSGIGTPGTVFVLRDAAGHYATFMAYSYMGTQSPYGFKWRCIRLAGSVDYSSVPASATCYYTNINASVDGRPISLMNSTGGLISSLSTATTTAGNKVFTLNVPSNASQVVDTDVTESSVLSFFLIESSSPYQSTASHLAKRLLESSGLTCDSTFNSVSSLKIKMTSPHDGESSLSDSSEYLTDALRVCSCFLVQNSDRTISIKKYEIKSSEDITIDESDIIRDSISYNNDFSDICGFVAFENRDIGSYGSGATVRGKTLSDSEMVRTEIRYTSKSTQVVTRSIVDLTMPKSLISFDLHESFTIEVGQTAKLVGVFDADTLALVLSVAINDNIKSVTLSMVRA